MHCSRASVSRRRPIDGRVALATCLLLLSQGAQASSEPRVHLPDGSRPPILDRLEIPPAVQTLAVSPDGNRAALAVALPATKGHDLSTEIRVYGIDGSVVVTPVQGHVRDLLFADDILFGILHRPAKRHEGDASLVSIDLASRKARREMRLPPSARDIESWDGGRLLLVAARNEIRTITLPLLRSGPLYRVPGENLSIAAPGGTRILIGQDAALLLVDLADPQERESMPIRERLATSAPIVSLAMTTDGAGGLAGLADGRVVALTLSPLALEEVGSGLVVSRHTPSRLPSQTPPPVAAPAPTPAPPRPEPPAPAPPRARAPAQAPVTLEPAIDSAERPQPAAPPREEPPVLDPAPAAPEPPASEQTAPEPLAVAPAPVAVSEAHVAPDEKRDEEQAGAQLRGRIDGPAARQVVAVVAHGPDSLLREAARVAPDDDGRWAMRGLAPGRYRIQLDGGGARALVTQPPFRQVQVTDAGAIVVDFRVMRAF